MIVTFKQQGRFGNNIFQYLATKIIQYYLTRNNKHFKVEYDFYPNTISVVDLMRKGMSILPESQFKIFYENLKNGLVCNNINIMLDGYFQYDYLLLENQDLIFDTLLNEKNNDNITLEITISKLIRNIKEIGDKNVGKDNYAIKFNNNELVMHLRLDDFINNGDNSFIIHPESYIDLITSILNETKKDFLVNKEVKIVIVCDKIKKEFETKYINYLKMQLENIKIIDFLEKVNVIITEGTMFEDFSRLFYAKNLICNNSTFCWIAGFLGENEKNWIPNKNTCENQSFFKINDETKIYNIKYITLNEIMNLKI